MDRVVNLAALLVMGALGLLVWLVCSGVLNYAWSAW